MKKLLSITSLTLVALGWCAYAALAQPTAYVRGILEKTMAVQSEAGLGPKDRARAIHQIIAQNFDFAMMARDSLGPAYGQLSAGQRQEFTTTFSYLFQDSYTRMVLNFLKRENIQYHQERRENSKARVDTTIVRTNETIPVTYLMHTASQGWILYDVIVDGVSILNNYQTQFGQTVRTKSFDYLLNKMREQRRALE